MNIIPNGVMYFLVGVKLDSDYKNTINFTSKDAQEKYFLTKIKQTPPNIHIKYNYIGFDGKTGCIKTACDAHYLYNCNYLMFQNTGIYSKWFYAFIKKVDPVSENCCKVYYEIDVLQTWHFTYIYDYCVVEREHVTNDAIGANLLPENLEIGEYVNEHFTYAGDVGGSSENFMKKYAAVVATSVNEKSGSPGGFVTAKGGIYNALPSGLAFKAFRNESRYILKMNEYLERLTDAEKSDAVVSIFLMPMKFVPPQAFTGIMPESSTAANVWFSKPKYYEFNGYRPRNKKLCTFPYNYLYVTNCNDQTAIYPYEYFSGSRCQFFASSAVCCSPTVTLVPKNYKGIYNNYLEKISISGYPQIPYIIDGYRAWLAQNQSGIEMEYAGAAVSTGLAVAGALAAPVSGGSSLALAGMFTSGIASAMSAYDKQQHASELPPKVHGSLSSSQAASMKILDFSFCQRHITREYAERIDRYFDMFGYFVNKIKKPNRSSRPHYNFIKTQGCKIHGEVPAEDAVKIEQIHNRGVTFWKNPEEIGNYSLNNSI